MIVNVWEFKNGVFEKVEVIDGFSSLIWIRRYQSLGECELYLGASLRYMELFTRQNLFLTREGNLKSAMKVVSVELKTSAESGDYLTVRGQSAECLLKQRFIWGQYNIKNSTPSAAVEQLITENLIEPTRPAGDDPISVDRRSFRKMSFVTKKSTVTTQTVFNAQFYFNNLLETVLGICTENEIGIRFDFTGSAFECVIYEGQDLTGTAVFSPAFDNIAETEYSEDYSDFSTMAAVYGEGDGTSKVVRNVDPDPLSFQGINRYEIAIDASGVSRTTESGEMDLAEYYSCLEQQGRMQLGRHKVKRAFSGTVISTTQYRPGTDYDLGDKVAVQNEYGITGTARVNEISEVYDSNGYQIYPTLSDWTLKE